MGWPKGVPRTPEHQAKISAGLKRAYLNGRIPRRGPPTPEHLVKLIANAKLASAACTKYLVGDKFIDKKYGYVMVVQENRKRSIPEHRLIAEFALGRKLRRSEVIHHINGDKIYNRNENLLVCSHKYHAELHQRMSYLYQQQAFGGA